MMRRSWSRAGRVVNALYEPGTPKFAVPPPSNTPEAVAEQQRQWSASVASALQAHGDGLGAEPAWSHADLDAAAHKHAMYPWGPTTPMLNAAFKPCGDRPSKGCYFYIRDRAEPVLDFNSQAMCLQFGHSPPAEVVAFVAKQLAEHAYTYPGMSLQPIRAKLAHLLSHIVPGDINSFFFPSSGTEANEAAVRIARLYTGRHKVATRYRSYHGGTNLSMMLTGDFRRFPSEPGAPGVLKFFDPYPYSFSWGETEEEICQKSLDHLREFVQCEGPQNMAAILIETVTGTNGVLPPPQGYLEGVRKLCDETGIMMICDEVMAGFGRTGKAFGFMHAPSVIPDIVTFAKGLNGGFLPLGGVGLRDPIADHFRSHPIWAGSTYNSHPVALASAYAVLRYALREGLLERAAELEPHMKAGMQMLMDRHPCVKQTRVLGAFSCFDIQKNEQGDFIAKVDEPLPPAMGKFRLACLDDGLFTMMRGHNIFANPPLIITKEEIEKGFDIFDRNLHILDEAME